MGETLRNQSGEGALRFLMLRHDCIRQRWQGRIGRGRDLWAGPKDSGAAHLLVNSKPESHGHRPPSETPIEDTASGEDADDRRPARSRQQVRSAQTALGSNQARHRSRKGGGRREVRGAAVDCHLVVWQVGCSSHLAMRMGRQRGMGQARVWRGRATVEGRACGSA